MRLLRFCGRVRYLDNTKNNKLQIGWKHSHRLISFYSQSSYVLYIPPSTIGWRSSKGEQLLSFVADGPKFGGRVTVPRFFNCHCLWFAVTSQFGCVACSWCFWFAVCFYHCCPFLFGWWYCKSAVRSTLSIPSVVVFLVKISEVFINMFSVYTIPLRVVTVWSVPDIAICGLSEYGLSNFCRCSFFLGIKIGIYWLLLCFSLDSWVAGQTHRQVHWTYIPVSICLAWNTFHLLSDL